MLACLHACCKTCTTSLVLVSTSCLYRRDMCANHHSARCIQMFCCFPCRRLADALDSGVTSLATRHAIEALHALATHLPTSRDLILATGAVAKLVALLRDSCAQAHYSMLKVVPLPQAHVLCACTSHCLDCACLFVSGPASRSKTSAHVYATIEQNTAVIWSIDGCRCPLDSETAGHLHRSIVVDN